MLLKLPRTRRFVSQHAWAHTVEELRGDDPWAGEDADWQVADERSEEHPAAFARFFRAVVLAGLVGALFWVGVVLLVLRLL